MLFPGLEMYVPHYGLGEDALFALMAILTLPKILFLPSPARIPLGLWLSGALVLFSTALSAVATSTEPPQVLLFLYPIARPFILVAFLFVFQIDGEWIVTRIVRINRVLLLINAPTILFNMFKYNTTILQNEYQDAIAGFGPFSNNDTIVWMVFSLILFDTYRLLFKRKRRLLLLCVGEAIILFATMNFKYILALSGLTVFMLIVHLRRMAIARLAAVLMIASLIYIVMPLLVRYSANIDNTAVFVATYVIVSGKVTEHNALYGTGPGSFTSPAAFKRGADLTYKYGLMTIKKYWEDYYEGVTGTFTAYTSSFSTLLGDGGILLLASYLVFIGWLVITNMSLHGSSAAAYVGLGGSLAALSIGLFLNSWFWGIDILLASVGARQVYALRRLDE